MIGELTPCVEDVLLAALRHDQADGPAGVLLQEHAQLALEGHDVWVQFQLRISLPLGLVLGRDWLAAQCLDLVQEEPETLVARVDEAAKACAPLLPGLSPAAVHFGLGNVLDVKRPDRPATAGVALSEGCQLCGRLQEATVGRRQLHCCAMRPHASSRWSGSSPRAGSAKAAAPAVAGSLTASTGL